MADAVMRMPELGVQRQPKEEKDELIQTKVAVEQIFPLVQRQIEEEEGEEPIQTKLISPELPILQRQEEIEEENEPLMTKDVSSGTQHVRDDLHSRLSQSKGGGKPLADTDRNFMESMFGIDFSSVRLHTDSNAVQMSSELNAQAFTHGRDIYFRAGRYSPGTTPGKRLLAHELTHVVQQGSSLVSQQAESIRCNQETPEWKKREKRFKLRVEGLKPRARKSNIEKFKAGIDKLLFRVGKGKTAGLLFSKLRLNPKGRLLWYFVIKTGTSFWLMKRGKLPNVIPDIPLRKNLYLDVDLKGTFKKPSLLLKLKLKF